MSRASELRATVDRARDRARYAQRQLEEFHARMAEAKGASLEGEPPYASSTRLKAR
jgi:hypothetical protein